MKETENSGVVFARRFQKTAFSIIPQKFLVSNSLFLFFKRVFVFFGVLVTFFASGVIPVHATSHIGCCCCGLTSRAQQVELAGQSMVGEAASSIQVKFAARVLQGQRVILVDGRVRSAAVGSTVRVEVVGVPDTQHTVSLRRDGRFTARLPLLNGKSVRVLVFSPEGRRYPVFAEYPVVDKSSDFSPSPVNVVEDWDGGDSKAFAFLATDSVGRPVRWDPCTPIYYKINPTGMPEYAKADIDEAFSRLGAASGYTFVNAGTTHIMPFATGAGANREQWTILVGFSDPVSVSVLDEPNRLGWGGFRYSPDTHRITSGGVVINASFAEEVLQPGFSRQNLSFGRLMLHELGHVMNLNHVSDTQQAMYSHILSFGGASDFGRGDRAAFALMVEPGCFSN